MKIFLIAIIASGLIACSDNDNRSNKKSSSTTVGAFALDLIENQTTEDAEPVDVNSINFKSEEDEDEFIEVDA
ncbi:MAG: hypothetical protein ACMZ64_06060 [Oleiphilus sp.]